VDAKTDRRRSRAHGRADTDARAAQEDDSESEAEARTERGAFRLGVAAVGPDLAVGHHRCGAADTRAITVEHANGSAERCAVRDAAGDPVAVGADAVTSCS